MDFLASKSGNTVFHTRYIHAHAVTMYAPIPCPDHTGVRVGPSAPTTSAP